MIRQRAPDGTANAAPDVAKGADFRSVDPLATISQRLEAMELALGANHPDVATVKDILSGVSEAEFARLRAPWQGKSVGQSAAKFADVVYWTHHKLLLARRLGLDVGPPRSIWDIGCGGGHFLRVCEHFGHRVIGTDIENPIYRAIAAGLGVTRTINAIMPGEPTTDFGRKFDLVTAVAVEFNHLHPQTRENPRFWTIDHWKYLLDDIVSRKINFPARIYIKLNCELRDGKLEHNSDLLALCKGLGAEADERSGIIDWRLNTSVDNFGVSGNSISQR